MIHDHEMRPLNISLGAHGSNEAKSVFHTVQFRPCGFRTSDDTVIGSARTCSDIWGTESNSADHRRDTEYFLDQKNFFGRNVWVEQNTLVVGNTQTSNNILSSNG